MLKVKRHKEDLTLSQITNLINYHKGKLGRFKKLKNLYDNNSDIKQRTNKDVNKPNNKLSHAFAHYITSTATGYFVGKPIQYSFPNEVIGDTFEGIFKYNDELDVNNTLATNASIYGCAAEVVFLDNNKEIRFAPLEVTEIIYIVNPDVLEDIHTVIRHWEVLDPVDNETVTYVEIYTEDTIRSFNIFLGAIRDDITVEHQFKDVPIIIYKNNDDMVGDFELVTDLIDAYDKAQSDTANDFEEFTNCYLSVSGVLLDDEAAADIKNLRLFNFPNESGKVEFVTKTINDSASENYKTRLASDIHKLSAIPDLSDKNFSGNLSGVSLQYKLAGLEYQTSIKESKFKKGILRRIELISNFLSVRDSIELDIIKEVDIKFSRNLIGNNAEMTEMVKSLQGIISRKGQINLLKDLIDPSTELANIQEEEDNKYSLFNDYETNHNQEDEYQQLSTNLEQSDNDLINNDKEE